MRIFHGILTAAVFSLFYITLSSNQDLSTMQNPDSQVEKPVVLIKTTKGDFKIELFPKKAPISVQNFLRYVKEGHYDNTIFHRVIDGFMVQGGGFTADLNQKSVHEGIKNEAENGLKNNRGTVAMARTQVVDSATAQFFVNVTDNSFLDNRGSSPQEFGYCVFGHIIEGMETVDKIEAVETTTKGPYRDVPATTVEITEARLLTN